MDLKVGDKVMVTQLVGCDTENGVQVGDVAKVVLADNYAEDYWCFNPRWKRFSEESNGNYMRLDQIKKIN